MSANKMFISKDNWFLIGMKSMLNDLITPPEERIVFIDARLEYIDFNYTPLEKDHIIYVTPEPYNPALKELFHDYFKYGQFITATSNVNIIKEKIATQKKNPNYITCSLTKTEKMVICTLASTGSYYKCARRLMISRKTVSAHKINTMNKLGLKTLNQLLIIPNFLSEGNKKGRIELDNARMEFLLKHSRDTTNVLFNPVKRK